MSPTSYRAAPPRGDESHFIGGAEWCQPNPSTSASHPALSTEGRGRLLLEGFAARPVVAVELAARVDGDTNGGLGAHGRHVVPAVLGAEDEVAGAGVDGGGLVLDVPVDLALEHHPPLVMEMIVRIVGMPGGVTDDEGFYAAGRHERLRS